MTHISDNLLNEYLDQQLDTAVHERLTAHLTTCNDCQLRLSEAEQLFATLDALPEIPLMGDLSRQVVARLTAEFKPRPLPRWIFPVIVLQMIGALALSIWLWPVIGSALETVGREIPQVAGQLLPELSLSQLLNPLINSFDRLSDLGETLSPDFSLPIYQGFLIIGLALIFWLAGSGLVLRQSLFVQNDTLGEG